MGRKATPRKRLGDKERKLVERLLKRAKSLPLAAGDSAKRETTINKTLIAFLQKVDPDVTSLKTVLVKFAGEKFVPDAVLLGGAAYPLLAVECKKLSAPKLAKKCWKEGLAQAALYARRYKVVFLLLYDFTLGGVYKKAFGRGNKSESSLAREMREARIHVVVVSP